MIECYADLHIHSFHSDGTMSPSEILAAARDAGVGLVAIADHNVLDGSRELRALAEGTGIRAIPAVELDCLHHGENVHILGYGVDLDDPEFVRFVRRDRELLDLVSVRLIEKMAQCVPGVSAGDFARFEYDRRLGGWKALHYFMHKGLTGALKEGLPLYGEYGCSYDAVDFPSAAEVCRAVKRAGGRPVLAHPGETIGSPDTARLRAEVLELVGLGVEGLECYYPTHTGEVTAACLEICREHDLLVTAGSDCHGAFGKTAVGEGRIHTHKLRLKNLLNPHRHTSFGTNQSFSSSNNSFIVFEFINFSSVVYLGERMEAADTSPKATV
jgi:predicted metal-dependent phosphoesterase TrpH